MNSGNKVFFPSPSKKAKLENHPKNVQLILIALCCYHKCTWSSFVGREFLIENGFNEADFHHMTQLCSWAVCGHRQSGSCESSSFLLILHTVVCKF